jgi:ssDNA-binding Zn-finger/Zn-ribbon topoisomerase 1
MKYECPNCKQFKYEKGWSNSGCGWILLLGLPIFIGMIPGASGFYGGTVDMGIFVYIIPLSMIIGVIVLIFSFISPQKTIDYTCSNCNFTQKHKI